MSTREPSLVQSRDFTFARLFTKITIVSRSALHLRDSEIELRTEPENGLSRCERSPLELLKVPELAIVAIPGS